LRIAFVVLGDVGGGIRLHAQSLADELARSGESSVAAKVVALRQPGLLASLRTVGRTIRAVHRADVVVVPYSKYGLWSDGLAGLAQVLAVLVLAPPSVFVLHDVYGAASDNRVVRWTTRAIVELADGVVVQEEHERAALPAAIRSRRSATIPLAIGRPPGMERRDARERLDVDPDVRVISVLGWIHPRKRHEDVLRVLPALPGEPLLWFIGGASDDGGEELVRLLRLAEELGVLDRFLITGFIPDDEFDLRVAASDLGVCLFNVASASASALSWLGAGRPIVASDIPLMQGLHAEAPELVDIVAGGRPELVNAIEKRLARGFADGDPARAIRERRSMASTGRQYLALCREVAR
jgi:glycosyltransferase involved in cell wall biosynthesis